MRTLIMVMIMHLLTLSGAIDVNLSKEEPIQIRQSIIKPVSVRKQVVDTTTVEVTVYNAVVEQCNEDPEHTAFMFKLDLDNPYKHRIIAVSRDLLKEFPNGTKVKIIGTGYDGIFTVRDKMNKRFTKRIDILINEDMSIGKWDNVKLVKVNESELV